MGCGSLAICRAKDIRIVAFDPDRDIDQNAQHWRRGLSSEARKSPKPLTVEQRCANTGPLIAAVDHALTIYLRAAPMVPLGRKWPWALRHTVWPSFRLKLGGDLASFIGLFLNDRDGLWCETTQHATRLDSWRMRLAMGRPQAPCLAIVCAVGCNPYRLWIVRAGTMATVDHEVIEFHAALGAAAIFICAAGFRPEKTRRYRRDTSVP